MKRRDLVLLLGGTLASAQSLRAQQRTMPVVGYIVVASPDVAAFRQGLSGSDNYKREVDELVRATGMDVPEAVPDPVDVVRSHVAASSPATLDLQAMGITTVIWANGYGFDYSWVNLPVIDEWGYPIQRRGVTQFPGLYFLGMNFLHYRKSGILLGVGDDAAYIVEHITGAATLRSRRRR